MAKEFPLKIILQAVDRATGPVSALNKKINQSLAPVKNLQRNLRQLNRELGVNQLQKSLRGFNQATNNLVRQVRSLAFQFLALGGAAVYGLNRMIRSVSDVGDRLAKMSARTGVSVESLQTLGFAAERSGISSDLFNTSLERFSRTLGEIKMGTGAVYRLFRQGDNAFLKQIQGANTTEEAFRLMLSRIRQVPDEARQLALAQQIFGRSGSAIVNLARLGDQELLALENRQRSLGIITAEAAKKMENWNDSMLDLSKVAFIARAAFVEGLLPVTQELIGRLTLFLQNNRQEVARWGREFAERIPTILKVTTNLLKSLAAILAPIGRLFIFVSENANRFEKVLKALFLLMASKAIFALIGTLTALGKVLFSIGLVAFKLGAIFVGVLGFKILALIGILALMAYWWRDILGVLVEMGLIIKNVVMGALNLAFSTIQKIISTAVSGLSKLLDILPSSIRSRLDLGTDVNISAGSVPKSQVQTNNAEVTVRFDNLPQGARVQNDFNDFLNLEYGLNF